MITSYYLLLLKFTLLMQVGGVPVPKSPPVPPMPSASAPNNSTLQGVIASVTGAPISNATVYYLRLSNVQGYSTSGPNHSATRSVYPPDPLARHASAATNSQGSFTVSGLPYGSYRLCMEAQGFLDPCKWSLPISHFVGQSQNVDFGQIKLNPATILRVQVNDPGNLVNFGSAVRPSSFIVGVWTTRDMKAVFVRAASVSRAGNIITYEVPVAINTPFDLWIFSRGLVISMSGSDALLKPVSAGGARIPLFAPSSNALVVNLTASASQPVGSN